MLVEKEEEIGEDQVLKRKMFVITAKKLVIGQMNAMKVHVEDMGVIEEEEDIEEDVLLQVPVEVGVDIVEDIEVEKDIDIEEEEKDLLVTQDLDQISHFLQIFLIFLLDQEAEEEIEEDPVGNLKKNVQKVEVNNIIPKNVAEKEKEYLKVEVEKKCLHDSILTPYENKNQKP